MYPYPSLILGFYAALDSIPFGYHSILHLSFHLNYHSYPSFIVDNLPLLLLSGIHSISISFIPFYHLSSHLLSSFISGTTRYYSNPRLIPFLNLRPFQVPFHPFSLRSSFIQFTNRISFHPTAPSLYSYPSLIIGLSQIFFLS